MDRTLTDRRLRVVPTAMVALDRARTLGVRIVLATGRTPKELQGRGDLLRHFDGLVVEGGALYGDSDELKPLRPHAHLIDQLGVWLGKQGIDHRRGSYAVSVARATERRVRRFPKIRGFHLAANRDRIDITLAGVDKGRALRRLLRERFGDLAGRRLVFADGENDASLFRAAHYRVAVANAVPELKRHAHEVLPEYGGKAVARFLSNRLLPAAEKR